MGIGLFGYYMPLIPGTIFMIISAYFFMNSSQKYYNKVINHPVYGNSIKQYVENNVIPFKSKIMIMTSIWLTTSISLYVYSYAQSLWQIKLLAVILSIIGTIVVLKAKHN